MSFRPVYLDASALAKLVQREAESPALTAYLAEWPDRVTSALSAVELARMLRRARASAALHAQARAVLDGVARLHVDELVLAAAGAIKDPLLRTLDAIHLGTALSLGDHPESFVTYDDRLARAARRAGLTVIAPE